MPGARGSVAWGRDGEGSYAVVAKPVDVPAAVRVAAAVLVSALAALLPATASAQVGGTGGTAPVATPAPRMTPPAPSLPPLRSKIRLTTLACVTGCAPGGAARPGALLRVRGSGLRRTAEIAFDGAPGEADDVAAAPVKRRRTSVDVRVPLGAVSGPVTVMDRDGVDSPAAAAPSACASSSSA